LGWCPECPDGKFAGPPNSRAYFQYMFIAYFLSLALAYCPSKQQIEYLNKIR
jgi:hypothetical protein